MPPRTMRWPTAHNCRRARPCWCWGLPVAWARQRYKSPKKCALCRSIGADASIDYSQDNLREAIKTLTDGQGPQVIYDPVGGDLSEPAFRSIAWRGRHLVVGFASGPIPALPWNLALLKGASIVG